MGYENCRETYLYRISLVHANFTIFLNNDDRQLFIDRRMVNPDKSAVLPEWVDAEHFGPEDEPEKIGRKRHERS